MPECIFCRIVAGEIPADMVRSTSHTVAFRDLNPQAPVHILVVPRTHYDSLLGLVDHDSNAGAEFLSDVVAVARDLGLEPDGFRMVLNTGKDGGQTVEHLHAHVLGGRPMNWPPG